MKKVFAMTVAAIMMAGCTVSEGKSRGVLEAQGFTDVELGGPALIGCSEGDRFTRTFEAKGANDTRVKGVICAGLFKGATVRTTSVKSAPKPPREQPKW